MELCAGMRRLAGLLVVVWASAAWGHDSWLIPDAGKVKPGDALRVMFVTSENFPQPQTPTKAERVDEWLVVAGEGRKDIKDFTPETNGLSATAEVTESGTNVIGIALKGKLIELSREKFEQYLASEGAEGALRVLRARAGDEPQRELFTKFAKTYVEAGNTPSAAAPPAIGHALEIEPLSNPSTWRVGQKVRVRVYKNGNPAPGLRVSTGHEGLPPHAYGTTVTTDRDGYAEFTLDAPGLWFLRTHTIDNVKHAGGEYDWASLWASMTFPVAAETRAATAEPRVTTPNATPVERPKLVAPPPALTERPAAPTAPTPAAPPHVSTPAQPARLTSPPAQQQNPGPTAARTASATPAISNNSAASDSQIDAMLEDVRAIHGMPGPWAVAGYRMGQRALRELGLPRGSFDLDVIHESPQKVQYTCIADGVQAATGASAGKLNLHLRDAKAENMRTAFVRKSTGKRVVIELSDAAKEQMMDVPYEQLETQGRVIAGMPEGDLLIVVIEK